MLRRFLTILVFIFCSIFVFAQESQDFEKVQIDSIYDGDTFKVYLDCKYPIFCKKISVRVKNIDTPELKTKNECEKKAGIKAKEITQQFLSEGEIILRNCTRGKYFRIVCEVKNKKEVNGKKVESDLAETLIKNNLAYYYYGQTKEKIDWCNFVAPSTLETDHIFTTPEAETDKIIVEEYLHQSTIKNIFYYIYENFIKELKKNLKKEFKKELKKEKRKPRKKSKKSKNK